MAIVTAGFQGSVSEVQWGKINSVPDRKYRLIAGTPVRGAATRQVIVDPRGSVGCGVLVENTTAETLSAPAVGAGTGRWYLLVLRRTWGTSRGAAYLLLEGDATANAVQSVMPNAFPASRQESPGLVDDEPVAWVHIRSGTSVPKIWNLMRLKHNGVLTDPSTAWASTANGISQRSVNFQVPVSFMPSQERLIINEIASGSGWGIVTTAGIGNSDEDITAVSVRFQQNNSTAPQPLTVVWSVIPI